MRSTKQSTSHSKCRMGCWPVPTGTLSVRSSSTTPTCWYRSVLRLLPTYSGLHASLSHPHCTAVVGRACDGHGSHSTTGHGAGCNKYCTVLSFGNLVLKYLNLRKQAVGYMASKKPTHSFDRKYLPPGEAAIRSTSPLSQIDALPTSTPHLSCVARATNSVLIPNLALTAPLGIEQDPESSISGDFHEMHSMAP